MTPCLQKDNRHQVISIDRNPLGGDNAEPLERGAGQRCARTLRRPRAALSTSRTHPLNRHSHYEVLRNSESVPLLMECPSENESDLRVIALSEPSKPLKNQCVRGKIRRRMGDSNPRGLAPNTLSKRAP